MFGGPLPDPPSKTELKAAETEANKTVQRVLIGSLLLYLSPFLIDYARKLV